MSAGVRVISVIDTTSAYSAPWPTPLAIATLPDNCECVRGPLCQLAMAEITSDHEPDGPQCGHDTCLNMIYGGAWCRDCQAGAYDERDAFCRACGEIVRAADVEHDGGTYTDFDGTLASWGDGAPYHPSCLADKRHAAKIAADELRHRATLDKCAICGELICDTQFGPAHYETGLYRGADDRHHATRDAEDARI